MREVHTISPQVHGEKQILQHLTSHEGTQYNAKKGAKIDTKHTLL